MSSNHSHAWRWLAAVVVAHLAVSIVHGAAHAEAHVPLSRAANLFVFIVILAGPLIGLALTWPAERIGSWLIVVTMGGSLVFGFVNHFGVASPDHVAHVATAWRPLFATTAVLLAVTEALGAGLAARVAPGREVVMKILVAGGTGTIGTPLVRALVADGHEVTALTRSPDKRDALRALGASAAVADALNREAMMAAVEAARPTHVIHQLTALPRGGPRRARDLEATNRLRIDGTRNLLEAAINAGVRRFIVGSFAMLSPREPGGPAQDNDAGVAVRSMERQVLDATTRGLIEGVIVRYGLFYGLEAPSTVAMIDLVRRRRLPVVRGDAGLLPLIHVEDAVSATVRALEAAPAGSAYDIVDDRPMSLTEIVKAIAAYTGSSAPFTVPGWLPRLVAPYMARMTSIRMPLSNARAKAELGWQPKYSTMRDGLAQMLRQAA